MNHRDTGHPLAPKHLNQLQCGRRLLDVVNEKTIRSLTTDQLSEIRALGFTLWHNPEILSLMPGCATGPRPATMLTKDAEQLPHDTLDATIGIKLFTEHTDIHN